MKWRGGCSEEERVVWVCSKEERVVWVCSEEERVGV